MYGNGASCHYQLGLGNMYNINVCAPKKLSKLENIIDVKGGKYYNIALCGYPPLSMNNIILIIEHWLRIRNEGQLIDFNGKSDKYIPNDVILIIKNFHSDKYKIYSTGKPDNDYGQDGHASDNTKNRRQWKIIETLSDQSIMSISCGTFHSLFLDQDGVIWSCGDNGSGQLGFGHNKNNPQLPPTKIPFFINNKIVITEIKTGHGHNLCLDNNGNIYSFGWNKDGQCGDGTRKNILKPQIIQYLAKYNIVAIKCGYHHSYAKSDDEKHFLFGNNYNNQCSLESVHEYVIPTPYCINTVFEKITNGRMIQRVYVGNGKTFIITKNDIEL